MIPRGEKDHPAIAAPPPLIFGVVLALGLLLHRYLPLFIADRSCALFKTMGNLLFLLSGLITLPTLVLMIRHKTALSPYKPTTRLVTTGLFRYSRNPLYIGLLLIYGGVTLHADSLWLLLLAPFLFFALDRGVVTREEEYLERKYGQEYREYKERVRRWI